MQPYKTLSDGNKVPSLGFGTWRLKEEVGYKATLKALEVGYRHIDTAEIYGNHAPVGKAIRESGIPRSELFVTSKVWIDSFHHDDVIAACNKALKELELEYLDLYLLHWPQQVVPIQETLGAMQELKDQKLIRSIGVSNFTIHHLQDAMATGVEIVNNQVEYHPSLNQEELREFCETNNIVITAYSPNGRGEDLRLPLVLELAEKYQRDAYQVILNWILAKGMITIPRSANPEHIESNFKTLEWQLDPEDVKKLDGLNTNNRLSDYGLMDFNY